MPTWLQLLELIHVKTNWANYLNFYNIWKGPVHFLSGTKSGNKAPEIRWGENASSKLTRNMKIKKQN